MHSRKRNGFNQNFHPLFLAKWRARLACGIGYGLDRLFHTAPFLMLIFIVLGFASGIISIVRATRATGQR